MCEMCEVLLTEGARLDKLDHECKTVLYEAACCGHMGICS